MERFSWNQNASPFYTIISCDHCRQSVRWLHEARLFFYCVLYFLLFRKIFDWNACAISLKRVLLIRLWEVLSSVSMYRCVTMYDWTDQNNGINIQDNTLRTKYVENKSVNRPHYMYQWTCVVKIVWESHYNDVILSAMAPQITSLTIVYSTVYSRRRWKKHQSSSSLAFVRGIHRWPVNSPHKGPVTRKMFPLDDVIMVFISDTLSVDWLLAAWSMQALMSCLCSIKRLSIGIRHIGLPSIDDIKMSFNLFC